MARNYKDVGDTAYNARRRYYRAAERYLKNAASAAGATAARYRELARQKLNDALKTYDKGTTQAFAKPIQKIANALGIDLAEERRATQAQSKKVNEKIRSEVIGTRKESPSFQALEGMRKGATSQTLREEEARAILNSPIGQRIIGGTVQIWEEGARVAADNEKGYKSDQEKILPQLYAYFNVENTADLLEKIEEITGDLLYSHGDMDTIYEAVKLMLQNKIASDNSVTR